MDVTYFSLVMKYYFDFFQSLKKIKGEKKTPHSQFGDFTKPGSELDGTHGLYFANPCYKKDLRWTSHLYQRVLGYENVW